jgi:hypothetical protein
MAGWTPVPATPLHGASEANPINVTITYVADTSVNPAAPQPTSYTASWISSPFPSLVTLTPALGPPRLIVSGPNVTGMAPITVDYMIDNVPYQVNRWDDLPAEAQQIYKYAISGINQVTAQFKVRANFANGSFIEQTYTLNATIDYSSGRDRLVSEIGLRR